MTETPALSTDERAVLEAITERDRTGEDIPERVARCIASWWQSPGPIGHEMAVFASTGTITDADKWQRDFNHTYEEAKDSTHRTDEERAFDLRALDALGLYVLRNVSFRSEPHLYGITVQTETRDGDYTGSVSSPTFYLDSNVQGIVSEDHAKRIVEHWLTDAGLTVLNVTAMEVELWH
jgi:hypothetical protein